MDKIAQVKGVLHYNDETREEMLKRIYWKDAQYTRFGGNFVRYAELNDREAGSLTGGNGLLAYTFGNDTEYGVETQRRYLGNNVSRRTFTADSGIPNGERWKWEGDYWENFTKDTELERIADIQIVKNMSIATYANNDRHLPSKYITPELDTFYGSSPGLNTKMFKYTFGQYYTGRISDIEEADVRFEDDYLQYLFKNRNGEPIKSITEFTEDNVEAPKRHMYNMFKAAEELTGKDYFSEEARYAIYQQDFTHPAHGRILNEDEFKDDNFRIGKSSRGDRYDNTRIVRSNFDEGDVSGKTPDGEINNEATDAYYLEPKNNPKSLLHKTNIFFKNHKIQTLAGRFHTSKEVGNDIEETDTAKSPGFGNSHGRNLLKKDTTTRTNGYENPYCRVWTYHHQYDKVYKLIRPFDEAEGEVHDQDPYIAEFKNNSNGREYLAKNTVLGKNGFVKIAPKGNCGNLTTEIKNCMFSIENLAWLDVPRNQGYLSKEQRGPNGGRIMWFPPYDLDFNEQVSVEWNQSKFIGRGEPVFTYSNTNRTGTLSFALLIDHPSIIDNIPKYNITKHDGDGDVEADVLRFFAGCQIPTLTKETDCDDKKAITNDQRPGDEPRLADPDEEKAKHIKFYIFFPNNYSGNGALVTRADFEANGPSDRAWFDYLMFGRDTEIAEDGGGYEKTNLGISTGDPAKRMEVNAVHKTWHPGSGIVNDVFYEYRVDFDLHEKLVNRYPGQAYYTRGMNADSNYKDTIGFRLNTELTNVPSDATHTFSQILASLYAANVKPGTFDGTKVDRLSTYTNDELVDLFKNHKAERIVVTAGATSQDSVNSMTLATRRARCAKNLIIEKGGVDETLFDPIQLVTTDTLKNPTTINSLEAKLQRYASVEIWYDTPSSQKLSETQHETDGTLIEDASGEDDDYTWDLGELNASVVTASVKPEAATDGENMTPRYETEAEYFKDIERTHPLVYKSIVEKFKYFSPAYHSISPEGFNARLTFLQQCTRQGHTISATDLNYAKTAGNLSFGRMPVCVLRIGDFINTKIIVNSVSINYGANGAPQWDLNPEGIGVQPMYAKVQMGITILGGQSLEGPVSRLQNAVTFNYYANTGVYDDRSDRVGIQAEKKIFNKENDEVRTIVETNGDKFKVYDESEYGAVKTVYNNIWSPQPNIVKKDEYGNYVTSYNEDVSSGKNKGK